MKHTTMIGLSAALWLSSAPAWAEGLVAPAPVSIPHAPADAHPQTVALGKLVSDIPAGTVWVTFPWKFYECPLLHTDKLTWRATDREFETKTYGTMLAQELKAAGFGDLDLGDNLFRTEQTDKADLLLAGNVKAAKVELCTGYSLYKTPDSVRMDRAKGVAIFTVDWQVYSKILESVLKIAMRGIPSLAGL